MSERYGGVQPPPEALRRPGDEVHEHVVERVRDVTSGGRLVIGSGAGDTGWRQVFPVTYDIPLDHPEAVETAEDE